MSSGYMITCAPGRSDLCPGGVYIVWKVLTVTTTLDDADAIIEADKGIDKRTAEDLAAREAGGLVLAVIDGGKR